ncbi:MAG: hypothetical protein JWN10_1721 [Solirubrobacterales bacterium]|nr:hypothetical protein [Solirubrobacterales bacterium]
MSHSMRNDGGGFRNPAGVHSYAGGHASGFVDSPA